MASEELTLPSLFTSAMIVGITGSPPVESLAYSKSTSEASDESMSPSLFTSPRVPSNTGGSAGVVVTGTVVVVTAVSVRLLYVVYTAAVRGVVCAAAEPVEVVVTGTVSVDTAGIHQRGFPSDGSR